MPTPADHLALARTARDGAVLLRLARTPYPFVWQALAANPHTPAAALVELAGARDSSHNDTAEVAALGRLPGASARLRRGLSRRLGARPPAYRLPGGEHARTEGNTAEG
ncbi:hypothetical protein ACF05R_11865 [Streptomyces albidoflavus]